MDFAHWMPSYENLDRDQVVLLVRRRQRVDTTKTTLSCSELVGMTLSYTLNGFRAWQRSP